MVVAKTPLLWPVCRLWLACSRSFRLQPFGSVHLHRYCYISWDLTASSSSLIVRPLLGYAKSCYSRPLCLLLSPWIDVITGATVGLWLQMSAHKSCGFVTSRRSNIEFVMGRTGPRKMRAPGPFPRPTPLNGLGRGVFFGIPCPCPCSGPNPTHTTDGPPLKIGGNKRGPCRK